tara:strand:- start:84 stop:350 length:267 start_codon:yes stop_codon:yes gene_type:complete
MMDKKSFGLVSTVVDVIEQVESILDLTGVKSKEKAMILIQRSLGDETYHRHSDVISSLIDFLCYITKNKKQLHLNEKRLVHILQSCCK